MMKVIGNRVLVKRLDEPSLKSSIIEVISHDKEPGQFAVVAAVGQGQRTPKGTFNPIDVAPGDLVVLSKYSGAPVRLKNDAGVYEDFQLVDAEDVLAVVQRPKAIPVTH
jgi:chaperonin GroES